MLNQCELRFWKLSSVKVVTYICMSFNGLMGKRETFSDTKEINHFLTLMDIVLLDSVSCRSCLMKILFCSFS